MAKLYVTEFASVGFTNAGGPAPFPTVPHTTTQAITIPGVSAAFAPTTKMVRLHADGICSFAFGTAPSATVNDSRLVAGWTEYYIVNQPNQKVSVVTNT